MGGTRDAFSEVSICSVWHYSSDERASIAAGFFAGMEKLCQR
jgi:hypothetical protein